MFDKAAFYEAIRGKLIGPTLDSGEVQGCEAILAACSGLPLAHAAYVLATPYHETNATMKPVREAYWLDEAWRKTHLRYYPYFGRGYPQITWEDNYKRADRELGLGGALLKNLDLALRPDISARILRLGMVEGWFTGKRLSSYLPAQGPATAAQFERARQIINRLDKAVLVASYATLFQGGLQAGNRA